MTTPSSDLMTEIPTKVQRWWSENHTPVLLSHLGGVLSEPARAELRVIKQSLRSYIDEHMPSIRLVDVIDKGVGAVPTDQAANLSDAQLSDSYRRSVHSRLQARRRFFPSVWAAFSRPMSETRRALRVDGVNSPTLIDDNGQEALAASFFEITLNDLPATTLGYGADPAPVAAAIRAWAEKTNLSLESLYAPQVERPIAPPFTQEHRAPSKVASAKFHEDLFGLLEPHELARINVPGDIVASLLHRVLSQK